MMNNHGPLVSIIIPTFNSLTWLPEAIDSSLAQTYPCIEVIVVDDGSTDGTESFLLSNYARRIHYLPKENGGLANARNYGLSFSKGDFIQFLDADDLLLPNPEIAVVYSHCQVFLDGSSAPPVEYPRKHLYRSGDVFVSMLERGYILSHMPLTRHEWIVRVGGFDETLTSGEDWDFWLRIAWQGGKYHYLEGPALVRYRIRARSMSTSSANHSYNGLLVVDKVRQYTAPASPSLKRHINRAEGRWRFAYGKASIHDRGEFITSWLNMINGLVKNCDNFSRKLGHIVGLPALSFLKRTRIWPFLKRVKDAI
jgi:glycosyltransferase involved in cell wall biosynthesis